MLGREVHYRRVGANHSSCIVEADEQQVLRGRRAEQIDARNVGFVRELTGGCSVTTLRSETVSLGSRVDNILRSAKPRTHGRFGVARLDLARAHSERKYAAFKLPLLVQHDCSNRENDTHDQPQAGSDHSTHCHSFASPPSGPRTCSVSIPANLLEDVAPERSPYRLDVGTGF